MDQNYRGERPDQPNGVTEPNGVSQRGRVRNLVARLRPYDPKSHLKIDRASIVPSNEGDRKIPERVLNLPYLSKSDEANNNHFEESVHKNNTEANDLREKRNINREFEKCVRVNMRRAKAEDDEAAKVAFTMQQEMAATEQGIAAAMEDLIDGVIHRVTTEQGIAAAMEDLIDGVVRLDFIHRVTTEQGIAAAVEDLVDKVVHLDFFHRTTMQEDVAATVEDSVDKVVRRSFFLHRRR